MNKPIDQADEESLGDSIHAAFTELSSRNSKRMRLFDPEHHAVYDTRTQMVIKRPRPKVHGVAISELADALHIVGQAGFDISVTPEASRRIGIEPFPSLFHSEGLYNRETHVVVPIADIEKWTADWEESVGFDDANQRLDVASRIIFGLSDRLPESEATDE